MANGLNRVDIIGNLGRDPEIRTLGSSGDKVASFPIAIDESYKKQDGEKVDKTEWVNVSVFNQGLVGVIDRYVKKGSKLHLTGKIETRKWTDKDGNDRYSTEVVLRGPQHSMLMLDGASGGGSSRGGDERGGGSGGGGRGGSQSRGGGGRGQYDLDDGIPF